MPPAPPLPPDAKTLELERRIQRLEDTCHDLRRQVAALHAILATFGADGGEQTHSDDD